VAVAAFDAGSGVTIWETKQEWPASYASPFVTRLHGKPSLLVFAGGDSNPPVGGLLRIDPETGALEDAFPWRSTKYESVNAATPLVLPGNRVMLSETYTEGGVLLEYGADEKAKPLWKAPELKLHFTTPLLLDGHIYAFTGRNEPDAGLDCWDAATGERKWREEFFWKKELGGRTFGWGFFRGALLRAEGRIYALGEMGTLAVLDLSPAGGKIVCQADLFAATQSWTLPALSRGLLYVAQNQKDLITGTPPRLLCYDLRAAGGGQ
jgi:outer membrane protein assembly factor BamB